MAYPGPAVESQLSPNPIGFGSPVGWGGKFALPGDDTQGVGGSWSNYFSQLPASLQFLASAPGAYSGAGGGNQAQLLQQMQALGLGGLSGDFASRLAGYGVGSLSDIKPYELPSISGTGTTPVFYDAPLGKIIPTEFYREEGGPMNLGNTQYLLKDVGGQAVPGMLENRASMMDVIAPFLPLAVVGGGMALAGAGVGGGAAGAAGEASMVGPATGTTLAAGGEGAATSNALGAGIYEGVGPTWAGLSGVGGGSLGGEGLLTSVGGSDMSSLLPVSAEGGAGSSPASLGSSTMFGSDTMAPVVEQSFAPGAIPAGQDSLWGTMQNLRYLMNPSTYLQGLGMSPGLSQGGGLLSQGLNLYQGLQGLQGSRDLTRLSRQAQERADPFGPYRPQYAQQLSSLMSNPSSITRYPGYEAGLEAVQRSMNAQGFMGSGHAMAELQKYGGDFYNQALSQLSSLAGAGFNPAAGAQIGLEGQASGMQLHQAGLSRLAQSLALLGW